MKKITTLLLFILLLMISVVPVLSQDKVELVWYIGLGTGAQPEQQEAQRAVVNAFNNSQDRIEVVINVVDNNVAFDTLSTLIAAGNAPDIIGPMGNDAANAYGNQFLDLQPLVDSTGYDLTQWPEEMVNFYRTDNGLLGLPLATFPSMIFYRPALFDEAGLNYPPENYGDMYVMPDGTEVEWTTDVVREIAMILTVDENGNDATMEEFDPENIIQWGFQYQWFGDGRQIGTMFGASRLWNPETGEAQMTDEWRTAFEWWYNGMWVDHFIPNAAQDGSDILGAGNAFNSGNLAMGYTHLWYTCCVEDTEWDIAPVPSHNGVITARIHADTFRVYAETEHPEEAFEFLTYLVGDAALDLLDVYGGMPARLDEQDEFFAGLDETYTQGVNWQVARDGLLYPDIPSHEAWFPNYLLGRDRITQFSTKLNSTPGLDIQEEIDAFISDMQVLFDEDQ